MNQGLVLNPQVLDLIPPLSQLDGNSVSFILDGFLLGQQDVSVDQDLLLPFLHAHLELVLLVLQPVDVVGGPVQTLFDLFDLELHDVVLHQHLLLLLGDLGQILDSHVVLQGQLLNLGAALFLGPSHIIQSVLDCPQVVVQLFDTLVQNLILTLDIMVLLAGLLHVLLEVLLLLESTLPPSSGHHPLHQLDLVLRVVEEFLLLLELLVEFVDVGLQVATSRHDALDLAVEGSLLLPELEELLGAPHRDLLLQRYLLFDLLLLAFLLPVGIIGNLLGILKFFSQLHLIAEFDFVGLELGLLVLEALLLLQQLLTLDVDCVPLVRPLGGERGELVFQDLHFCPQVGNHFIL